MKTTLFRWLDNIENAFAFLACILLLFATFSIGAQVISRTFFNYPLLWVDEVNAYILVYLPFLAGAWLARSSGHIAVDIIESMLSPRMRAYNDMLVAIIGIGVSAVLCWYGTVVSIDHYVRDIRSMSVIAIPKLYVIVIIPIGCLLLVLEFARKLYQAILARKTQDEAENAAESPSLFTKDQVIKEG